MTDMKKIAKYFFIAAASFAAMSCVEELNVVEKPVELTGKAYVFTADFDAETKTVLDEETMTPMWYGDAQGNEYITVMEPGSVNTYVAEGLTDPVAEATFVMAENGGTGLTGTAAFAVSPAGAWTCFNNSTNGVGVTVNYLTTQTAYADTYDPAAPVAVAYNEDIEANPNFSFKNASALLKFQITADSEPVKSVKFYSLGGETLAGEITLMNDADGKPAIVPGNGASSWVEIVAAEGKTLEAETNYYISVAPAVLAKGIGFQFNDMEGIETFTIPTEIKIERNKIYDLGIFRYEASKDDKWYLVGNGTTDFTTVMFQADGDNLVAKNVPFSGEQSFKVLNPAKGVAYYVNAKEVKTETWIDLTEEKGTVCPAKGTYDVYVDYVEETITGVALTTPGTYAPEYLVPAGYYTWVDDSQVEWGGSEYHYAISLDEYEMVYADSYDVKMASYPADYLDPTMTGKWAILGVYTDIQYFPTHATAGEFRCKSIQSAGGVAPLSAEEGEVQYHIVKYSDIVDGGMNVFSTSQMYDENGNAIPVLDADGNPIMVWLDWMEEYVPVVYSGVGGLSDFDEENMRSIPLSVSLSKTDLEFAVPVPTTGQFVWTSELSEYDEETGEEITLENCMKMFDLGVTEPGVIRFASYYDQLTSDPMTGEIYDWADPRLAGTWFTQMRFDKYEIVPVGTNGGEIRIYNEYVSERGQTVTEYYLIYYSNYTYKSMIALHSPSDIVDSEGNPIPVEGTDAYWQGLGIENIDWTGESLPVGMYDAEMYGMSGEAVDAPTTPDGAQWIRKGQTPSLVANFVEDAEMTDHLIDFGVGTVINFYGNEFENVYSESIYQKDAFEMTTEGWFGPVTISFDADTYYSQSGPMVYEIVPTDETSGVIKYNYISPVYNEEAESEDDLYMKDPETGKILTEVDKTETYELKYENYTGTTVCFIIDEYDFDLGKFIEKPIEYTLVSTPVETITYSALQ